MATNLPATSGIHAANAALSGRSGSNITSASIGSPFGVPGLQASIIAFNDRTCGSIRLR